ncbi:MULTISPECIES: hypothetical protein [unclassified Cryobacterium]|uniref:hypothetical protein n=1 Tax=unclassified Cryobacterium TaxID=2649013 RepID=UPI00106D7129|nr:MULTISPECIES: hypothetical protein [unclassified Cryobacterium]TFC59454.1 hypothetical protein E3O68_00715 [Cryobacterium sp. TMB3-1-2]TFC67250.1 hypothetical protein E3T21_17410 [Cryobacterium sp. TMB3-15]TFC73237.1 hypothetical protein E3T22_16645 [Cryobacterium sp. TMB3-10]TFD46125.1 hypothetical protein E3T58_01280 [Cryobacterium sp. TMB3-12]
MSNIDHKAEAVRVLAEDDAWKLGWETADAQHLSNSAKAQVHATLYAAEQQRIANLIAYHAGLTAFHGESTRLSPAGRAISDALESQIEKELDL